MFALIIGFILGAAALLFVTENTAAVSLTFLQWQFETSIALLVLMAILVGFLLTVLFFLPGIISDALHMRRLRRDNDALSREAEAHRRAAQDARTRLAATGRPDVLDLSRS